MLLFGSTDKPGFSIGARRTMGARASSPLEYEECGQDGRAPEMVRHNRSSLSAWHQTIAPI
jgi:hypothetical protein